MGSATKDKALITLAGKPLWLYALEAFIQSPVIDTLWVVCQSEEQQQKLAATLVSPLKKELNWTLGGPERQDSVASALRTLPADVQYVFVHDCARPLIQSAVLDTLYTMVLEHKAVALAHPIVDTIKTAQAVPGHQERYQLDDLDRNRLWAMETPQVFDRKLICQAYETVCTDGIRVTDDAGAMSYCGHPVALYPNPEPNPKLTSPRDLLLLEAALAC